MCPLPSIVLHLRKNPPGLRKAGRAVRKPVVGLRQRRPPLRKPRLPLRTPRLSPCHPRAWHRKCLNSLRKAQRALRKLNPSLLHMLNPYYPETNDGRADWWQNIIGVGNVTLASLGFTATQTAAINLDAQLGVYLYRTLPATFEDFGKRVTGYISTFLSDPDGTPAPLIPAIPGWPAFSAGQVLAGLEARREKWVQNAKHAANYDPAVQGAVLRIETTGTPFDPNTYQAEIFGATSPGPATVLCKFRKARRNIDAMKFMGRKSGTMGWTELGRYTATPASLHIPLQTPGSPEQWELMGRALVKDQEIGLASDLLVVLVRG